LNVVYINADGSLFFQGEKRTFTEMDQFLASLDEQFAGSSFEILSDRRAPIQAMVSLLEMLRERGAGKVTIGTVQATPSPED
jgi:biopolymer transport protein ExbD